MPVQFQIIASILFIGLILYFAFRQTRKAPVKSGVHMEFVDVNESDCIKCTLQDVAGNEEAKECVEDIIDYMKNPDKYQKYGARVPRGVIFYGPPGTGKTLMAKAIAGEAEVPFYAVSGSDFVQMYVGVGANRIRELFKKAKHKGKAVIFIDEIDALGKKRGSSMQGGNDERDQTLNALLTEMSGFKGNEGVVIIAATNRIDTLDEALLRPGRFDRLVEIGLPDIHTRLSILNYHAKNKPLAKGINLNDIAKETVFFSGAMLENYLNEAAILSAKSGKEFIEREELEKAYFTIIAGSEKKKRSASFEKEKQITAYHEAAHALVTKLLTPENIISKVTIIPSTKGAGGFCINIPEEKLFYTKQDLQKQIMVNVAGRAGEELIFGENLITTGASNDIEKATAIAYDYVGKYGMGENTGLLNLAKFKFKDEAYILRECSALIDKLYCDTKTLLETNMEKLHNIANELIDKESLNEAELKKAAGM